MENIGFLANKKIFFFISLSATFGYFFHVFMLSSFSCACKVVDMYGMQHVIRLRLFLYWKVGTLFEVDF